MCCFLLCCRFRQLQLSADSRQSDLQKEINVKQFELEKMQMIHDETTSNLRQAKLEAEKYQSKSEVWLSSQLWLSVRTWIYCINDIMDSRPVKVY